MGRRHQVLATDYDGTLADHGRVDPPTLDALVSWQASGRKLLMVTGRERVDLEAVFPEVGLFDLIVAENGAVLHWPDSRQEELLAPPPVPALVSALEARGVPLSVGQSIISTVDPHQDVVEAEIHRLGLDLRVIPNKGSLMVLPEGVDKGSGLRAALAHLGHPPEEVVGVGDAENDFDFLVLCGVSVAVANALPALKSKVDMVTRAAKGAGVAEAMEAMMAADAGREPTARP